MRPALAHSRQTSSLHASSSSSSSLLFLLSSSSCSGRQRLTSTGSMKRTAALNLKSAQRLPKRERRAVVHAEASSNGWNHPLSPCISDLGNSNKIFQQQQQNAGYRENGATMRYIDRSFYALEKVVPPAGLLVLVSMFCATVLSVLFAALFAFKEVTKACRNVINACQAVIRSADAIERACSSVTTTTANLDNTTGNIDATVVKIDVLSESATKALDLPKDASNTLWDAISAVSVPINQKSVLPSKTESLVGTSPEVDGNNKNMDRSVLGMNINGRRLGAGWIGSDSNYRFHFSATNTFNVGEYVAVKRTNNLYTWGVVENNENVDPSCMPDENCPVDNGNNVEKTGPSCNWPPKNENAVSIDRVGDNQDSLKEDELNFFGRLKKFTLPIGLAPEQVEKEYRVVVEVSATVYRYKIVPASELGKRY